jgi:hypothetical protein
MNNSETAEVIINHLVRFGQLKRPEFKEDLKKQVKDLLDFEDRRHLERLELRRLEINKENREE